MFEERRTGSDPAPLSPDYTLLLLLLLLVCPAGVSRHAQATNLAKAVEEIDRMRRWRLSDRPVKPDEDEELRDPGVRRSVKATIFFSYTSNMVSCGVRETIRFLAQHKMVDVIVTSAGGIGASDPPCPPPRVPAAFLVRGCRVSLCSSHHA